jgi:Xaa-Pro aminopeptidase
MTTSDLIIPVNEYAERREKVLRELEGAAAAVLAGRGSSCDCPGQHRVTDSLFWYLTGLDSETGATVLFDPSAEDPDRRITLFLRPRDPEIESWEGSRPPLGSALKQKTGFASIVRTGSLAIRLTEAARRTQRLACLHPFASYEADVSPDLALFKKVCERVPTAAIEDRTQLLAAMRAVKSAAEISLIERAVEATAAAYAEALPLLGPGTTEATIADALTAASRSRGCTAAFEPIVGSGESGAIIHYTANDQALAEGELVVIDYGARCGGYAADVTRTLPVDGRFTPEQADLYEIVLQANLAAIEAVQPGATFTEVDKAARAVIAEAGHEDHFIHSVGHQLGIDVHDPDPDGPLVPGMVVTVEPGIYLAELGMGIRIEDDVLITKARPNKVLTDAIPKTVDAIESAMRGR